MNDVLNLDGEMPVLEVVLGGERHEIKPMEFEIALESASKAADSAEILVEHVRRISGIPSLNPEQALAVMAWVKNYVREAGEGKKKPSTSPGSSASIRDSRNPKRKG